MGLAKSAIQYDYPFVLGSTGTPGGAHYPNPAALTASLRAGRTWAESLAIAVPKYNSMWRAIGDPLARLPTPLQGYNVYTRGVPTGADTLIAVAPAGDTSVDLIGYAAGSERHVRVTAVSRVGVESADAVVLRRAAFDSGNTVVPVVPNAPVASQLERSSAGAVAVRWTYLPAGHAIAPATFRVYVTQGESLAFTFGTPQYTVSYANRHSFTQSLGTFAHGTKVNVIVRSVSAAGSEESNWTIVSAVADAMAPEAPTSLSVGASAE